MTIDIPIPAGRHIRIRTLRRYRGPGIVKRDYATVFMDPAASL